MHTSVWVSWGRSPVGGSLSGRLFPITILFLSASLSALAQDHPYGFEFSNPLSLSSGYDSHFVVGSETLSDTVSLLSGPDLSWKTTTHRTLFSFDYSPEFEFFAHRPDLDAWNHAATLAFRHRVNARWSVDFGDSFVSTMDSSRTLANSLILLPWGRFDQNTLFGDLVYRFDKRTKITFRADSVFTTVAMPSLHGALDNLTGAGTVTVDRSLSTRHQVSATYSFIHVTPLDPQPSRTPTTVNLGLFGYTYDAQPGWQLHATGGVTHGAQSGFTGSASIEKRVGGLWIAGGYQRYLGFFGAGAPAGPVPPGQFVFANGITPSLSYDTISLRAIGQLSRRIGLDVRAQRAVNGTTAPGLELRGVVGQARLDYRLNETVTLFARVEHYGQTASLLVNQPISRNRYFGGLEIALSRPSPKPRNQRVHRSEDSDVIPPVDSSPEEK